MKLDIDYVKGMVSSMDLAKKLMEVREAAQISRAEMTERLMEKGFDVKSYTLCKWETGVSRPSVEAFLAICDICQVKDIRETFSEKRLLRLYSTPVSAGRGNFLEDGGYEMIEVESTVPGAADYAVRISGDSMMPRFVDKQIVFVHEQSTLEQGEIGIFCLNGEAYVKKLGQGCLISLNGAYGPIEIGESDELRVLGKVVG